MSKFLTGQKLIDSIHDLVYYAKSYIVIVSPYIKLDNYLRTLFERHIGNQKLSIMLVFGKNSSSINKSIKSEDMEFFKSFPNISIVYVENLHAKYYANEKYEILTSLNLHEYSLQNNVEFGVRLFAHKIRKANTLDIDAWNNYLKIVKEYPAIFVKRPIVRRTSIVNWDTVGSEILHDVTEELYGNNKIPHKSVFDFKSHVNQKEMYPRKRFSKEEYDTLLTDSELDDLDSDAALLTSPDLSGKEIINEEIKVVDEDDHGYCINCGKITPLMPKKPLCVKCESIHKNSKIHKTSFCHICGREHINTIDKPAHNICYRKTKKILEY